MISWKSVFIFMALAIPFITPQTAHSAWFDDFTSQNNRWDWEYIRDAGYHRITTFESLSVAELGVTSLASDIQYSDSSLHEKNFSYTYGVLEMRIKTTDNNGLTDSGKGTRGWGFWDANTNFQQANVAWFWSASPESTEFLRGFRAQVFRNGTMYLNQEITGVDMRQWHTYRIEMFPSGTRFLIDGNLIASSSYMPMNNQRTEIWLDNYKINLPTYTYLKFNQDEKLYLDWIRYSENLLPSPTPSPSIIPSASPDIYQNLKILLSKYLSSNDNIYYPIDNKVNMMDAGYVILNIQE
jgi:hypothetical protein